MSSPDSANRNLIIQLGHGQFPAAFSTTAKSWPQTPRSYQILRGGIRLAGKECAL